MNVSERALGLFLVSLALIATASAARETPDRRRPTADARSSACEGQFAEINALLPNQIISAVILEPFGPTTQPIEVEVIFQKTENGVLFHRSGAFPVKLISPGSLKTLGVAPPQAAVPPPKPETIFIPALKPESSSLPQLEVKSGRVFGRVLGPHLGLEASDEDLLRGENEDVPSAVRVKRTHEKFALMYNRTNRGRKLLAHFYPKRIFESENLRGLCVLDLGTGGGRIVEEWRKDGVDAVGLDIALSSRQQKSIYSYPAPPAGSTENPGYLDLRAQNSSGYYIQADSTQTGIAPNQLDVIFSTYAMFEYDIFRESSRQFLLDTLVEIHRILKVGGKFFVSPLYVGRDTDIFRKMVEAVEGLELTDLQPAAAKSSEFLYAEVTKRR